MRNCLNWIAVYPQFRWLKYVLTLEGIAEEGSESLETGLGETLWEEAQTEEGGPEGAQSGKRTVIGTPPVESKSIKRQSGPTGHPLFDVFFLTVSQPLPRPCFWEVYLHMDSSCAFLLRHDTIHSTSDDVND